MEEGGRGGGGGEPRRWKKRCSSLEIQQNQTDSGTQQCPREKSQSQPATPPARATTNKQNAPGLTG